MFEALKTPANALAMNLFLIAIATFNLIDTQKWIDPLVYDYLPEDEAYSMNFKACGFEDRLLITNVSFYVWLYLLHFASILFFVLPIIILSRCCSGKLSCVKTKLTKYFFWNGMIRLFMETFLDFFLSAVLNVYRAVW